MLLHLLCPFLHQRSLRQEFMSPLWNIHWQGLLRNVVLPFSKKSCCRCIEVGGRERSVALLAEGAFQNASHLVFPNEIFSKAYCCIYAIPECYKA